MARKPKQPKPGDWKYQVENLTAYERKDRGLAIYTRVRNENGRGYRDKQRLCDPIREGGKIVPALEAKAIKLAAERQEKLAAGIEDVREDGPITIAGGFRRMLHDSDGKYASDTPRKRDVERYSATIIEILKGETPWAQVRHGHYRKIWRHLAREHAKDSTKYGPAAAEKIVGTLRTATTWLQEEELIEPGTCLPAPTWKQTMRQEWAEITDRPVQPPRKPRHTPAEQEKLWHALPLADPRLEAMAQVGIEYRLGQVVRSRRSDVHPFGGFQIGRVRIHGSGRKAGAFPILTMEARHVLTRAMTRGYLAELEAAYRAGEIDDYFLFPGGKLRRFETPKGPRHRVPVERGDRHWERTALRKAWRKLEQIAGVPHIPQRGHYGMRRLSTDLAEDVETDDRVLNETSGHTDTATRRKYQEQGRTEVAERSREVRERIRPKVKRGSA